MGATDDDRLIARTQSLCPDYRTVRGKAPKNPLQPSLQPPIEAILDCQVYLTYGRMGSRSESGATMENREIVGAFFGSFAFK